MLPVVKGAMLLILVLESRISGSIILIVMTTSPKRVNSTKRKPKEEALIFQGEHIACVVWSRIRGTHILN